MQNKSPKTFRGLFPEIPEDEVEEAEARFERYLKIVARIYAGAHNAPEILKMFGLELTEEDSNSD